MNNIYLPQQTINVPQDNDALLVVDVVNDVGELQDIGGATEIEFIIFTAQGGTAEVTKTMTGGDITIAGTDYQFTLWIEDTDTQSLTNRQSYYECRITNSDGRKRTVMAGLFRAEKTYIWSIP